MTNFQAARKNMVDCQISTNGVITPAILTAFSTIPRELFVSADKQHVAYTDNVTLMTKDRTLLDPMTHARLLEAAAPKPAEVALDIGSGTGYSSAILSSLVSTVISLENRQTTIDKATKTLADIGICNVAYVKGKLVDGHAKHAPYDLIILNGAVAQIPEHIIDQLAKEGRLLAIVQQNQHAIAEAVIVMKNKNGTHSRRTLFETSAPYLQGFEPKTKFAF